MSLEVDPLEAGVERRASEFIDSRKQVLLEPLALLLVLGLGLVEGTTITDDDLFMSVQQSFDEVVVAQVEQ
ncbi:hypothetical protein F0U63_39940 [Cystobacter fuscus]|nr:hypothetical protein F0U63_39940 [Cystobacter fuscus]